MDKMTLGSLISPPGHGPRLSEANLFTLLSLWMELFPQEQPEDDAHGQVGAQMIRERDHLEVKCKSSSSPATH